MRTSGLALLLLLGFLFLAAACDCGDDDDDDNDETGDDESPDDDASPVDDDASPDDDDDDSSPTGDDDDNDDTEPETFRIAVISDANIVDNDLLQWNENLGNVIAAINAEPDLDFLVILGDLGVRYYEWWWDDFHAGYDPDMTWDDCLQEALSILQDLQIPYYFVPGDKDYADIYQINFGFNVQWADREERNEDLRGYLGEAFPGTDPWYSFLHKGARFFAGNSMAGDRWQDGVGMTGSLGEAQLDALAAVAGDEIPTIFMSHHNGTAILEGAGQPTLEEVLSAKASGVMALFNGHHFAYQEYEFAGIDGYAFDAVSDGDLTEALYYAVAEIDPAARTVTIINKDDLPYPPEYIDYSCEPGESSADMSGLVGTFHTLFFVALETDYEVLNLLLAGAEMGETPFPLWVSADSGNDDYQVLVTQANMFDGAGDHGVYPITEFDVPCDLFTWHYQDPCLATVDAEVEYDVLGLIGSNSGHRECGIGLNYQTGFLMEATIGDDADGNTSFKTGQITVTLGKAKVVAAIEQFITDSYCAYDCEPSVGDLMTPADQCDAETNGDAAACDAGTLTFADVPEICDTLVGSQVMLPMRLILSLIELLPEAMEITFHFQGWGHEMLNADFNDMGEDWALNYGVWSWMCPVAPPFPSR